MKHNREQKRKIPTHRKIVAGAAIAGISIIGALSLKHNESPTSAPATTGVSVPNTLPSEETTPTTESEVSRELQLSNEAAMGSLNSILDFMSDPRSGVQPYDGNFSYGNKSYLIDQANKDGAGQGAFDGSPEVFSHFYAVDGEVYLDATFAGQSGGFISLSADIDVGKSIDIKPPTISELRDLINNGVIKSFVLTEGFDTETGSLITDKAGNPQSISYSLLLDKDGKYIFTTKVMNDKYGAVDSGGVGVESFLHAAAAINMYTASSLGTAS